MLPIELAILQAAIALRADGERDFHGYRIASALRELEGARQLTAHGTLYKALDRMRRFGLLRSRWEDPAAAVKAGRPRRRLYTVTPEGSRVFEAQRLSAESSEGSPARGWQPA